MDAYRPFGRRVGRNVVGIVVGDVGADVGAVAGGGCCGRERWRTIRFEYQAEIRHCPSKQERNQ